MNCADNIVEALKNEIRSIKDEMDGYIDDDMWNHLWAKREGLNKAIEIIREVGN